MSVLQKNKKVAAGVGVAAVAAAALALGAGTYAAYQDTEEGAGGTLAAGTLTMDVTSSATAVTELFSAENIAPGYVSDVRTVNIQNSGSINGVLNAEVTVTENTGGDLDQQLRVSGNCDGTAIDFSNQLVSILEDGLVDIPVAAGDTLTCNFTFSFPDRDDNNLAQGDTVTIASTFTLTQAQLTSGD